MITGEKEIERAADSNIDALIAAAIVRYVDNFIDEALWPRIHEYKKEVIEPYFRSFLERALAIAHFWDKNMPDEIIDLPLTELDLEFDPSQDNFDRKFAKIVQQKSFDMAYIDKLFSKIPIDVSNQSYSYSWYTGKSLSDLYRDFNDKDPQDFNIYQHIIRHHLDPSVFIEYVEKFLDDHGEPYGNDPEDRQIVTTCRLMLKELRKIKWQNVLSGE